MRRTPGWTDLALVALSGVAACADASTGAAQAGRVATPRAGAARDLSAPFVLGTGQIAGGLGNAEVQRTPGGGVGGGAAAPGLAAMGGEQPVDYVPAVPAAWPERRADRTAAAKQGSPNSEHVLQFSRAIDRAQAHVDARRYAPAVFCRRGEQATPHACARSVTVGGGAGAGAGPLDPQPRPGDGAGQRPPTGRVEVAETTAAVHPGDDPCRSGSQRRWPA